MYYYFDDINNNDLDLNNWLMDVKSYENTLIHDITYKTWYGVKFLPVILYIVDRCLRKYGNTKYLALFEKLEKSKYTNIWYTKIKINSDDDIKSLKKQYAKRSNTY